MPVHCYRMRAFDRDLIRGGHYGQRSCEPHTGRTHGCTDQQLRREDFLANSEPSTHGRWCCKRCCICSRPVLAHLRHPPMSAIRPLSEAQRTSAQRVIRSATRARDKPAGRAPWRPRSRRPFSSQTRSWRCSASAICFLFSSSARRSRSSIVLPPFGAGPRS